VCKKIKEMEKLKNAEIAQNIIELSGGTDNFKQVYNCMTRVRIHYVDEQKVQKEAIEKLDGVLGIQEADSFQIIVGPGKSTKIQELINQTLGGQFITETGEASDK